MVIFCAIELRGRRDENRSDASMSQPVAEARWSAPSPSNFSPQLQQQQKQQQQHVKSRKPAGSEIQSAQLLHTHMNRRKRSHQSAWRGRGPAFAAALAHLLFVSSTRSEALRAEVI